MRRRVVFEKEREIRLAEQKINGVYINSKKRMNKEVICMRYEVFQNGSGTCRCNDGSRCKSAESVTEMSMWGKMWLYSWKIIKNLNLFIKMKSVEFLLFHKHFCDTVLPKKKSMLAAIWRLSIISKLYPYSLSVNSK